MATRAGSSPAALSSHWQRFTGRLFVSQNGFGALALARSCGFCSEKTVAGVIASPRGPVYDLEDWRLVLCFTWVLGVNTIPTRNQLRRARDALSVARSVLPSRRAARFADRAGGAIP